MRVTHDLSTAQQEAIHAAVYDQIDVSIGLLQELVRIPSENPKLTERSPGEESACQDVIDARLTGLGMETDRFEALERRPDIVGHRAGSGGGQSLILNGHVDVVPAGDPENWRYPPFSGTVADGHVWGRGACDMKGGLVAAIMALEALDRVGLRIAGDISVQSVVDEETGGPGTLAAIQRGSVADAAICMEPTNLSLMPVEGGLEWVRIVASGVSGHAALRYKSVHAGGGAPAVNAIEKMVLILSAIQTLEREWGIRKTHPLLPAGITTVNPGVVLGGSGGGSDGMPHIVKAVATIPDYCSLELDLKYLPNEKGSDVKHEFEAFIARVAATDPWLASHPPVVKWGIRGVSFPPAETDSRHPLIQTIVRETTAVTGASPQITGFPAVSDLAWLAQAGMPCTLFGPGKADFAHALDERIAIEDLLIGTEILARVVATWCGLDSDALGSGG